MILYSKRNATQLARVHPYMFERISEQCGWDAERTEPVWTIGGIEGEWDGRTIAEKVMCVLVINQYVVCVCAIVSFVVLFGVGAHLLC